ncbi:MAG: TRAP transporter large permease [Oscillospiraceae bacterium]|nr:TRAP transporter large permease [Oscillospiraceae bacterium]
MELGLGVLLLIFIGVFVGSCVLSRIPVGFGMGLGAIALLVVLGLPYTQFLQASFSSLDSFTYLAIPLFVLAGSFMEHSGIAGMLVDWAESIIGKVRGGIGAICVVACAAFGMLTGSATSTLTSIGKIMIGEMKKRGYSDSYAGALAAATGFLGILIPPSGPAIIYAVIAGCSISAIWMSTVVPGIIIMIGTIVINYLIQGRKEAPIPASEKLAPIPHIKNFGKQTIRSLPALFMPIIIFGGIYGGIFTPTEAGAVTCVYAAIYFIVAKLRGKKMNAGLGRIFEESNIGNANIGLLTIFSLCAGRVISLASIDVKMAEFVLRYCDNPKLFLLAFDILLLFLGMLISNNAIILIVTPLLLPSAVALGISPIHFGCILMVATVYGNLTPPFATAGFIAAGLSGAPFVKVMRDAFPYLIFGLFVIALVTFVPQSWMWLVNITG